MLYYVAMGSSLATTFLGTAYVVSLWAAPPAKYRPSDVQRHATFDRLAPTYDADTKTQEWYLGISAMRKRLLRHARGRVLEVAAGTGCNVGLYNPHQCREVVLCDVSTEMVEQCVKRVQGLCQYDPPKYPAVDEGHVVAQSVSTRVLPEQCVEDDKEKEATRISSAFRGKQSLDVLRKDVAAAMKDSTSSASFTEGDSLGLYTVASYSTERLPFPDNSFDTVVDIFGLCSCDRPGAALAEMNRVLRPGGQLLLLEHGRGAKGWLNDHLDRWAPRHAAKWGCWWNRDVRKAIRLSGAGVVYQEERHFGTTLLTVLTPYKALNEKI